MYKKQQEEAAAGAGEGGTESQTSEQGILPRRRCDRRRIYRTEIRVRGLGSEPEDY